jgi:hypothetical protein
VGFSGKGVGKKLPERCLIAEKQSQRTHVPADLQVVFLADVLNQFRQCDIRPVLELPIQRRGEYLFNRPLALGRPERIRFVRCERLKTAENHDESDTKATMHDNLPEEVQSLSAALLHRLAASQISDKANTSVGLRLPSTSVSAHARRRLRLGLCHFNTTRTGSDPQSIVLFDFR